MRQRRLQAQAPVRADCVHAARTAALLLSMPASAAGESRLITQPVRMLLPCTPQTRQMCQVQQA